MTRTVNPDREKAGALTGRIGVIAGGGALPPAVVRTLLRNGHDPFVVLMDGEVEDPALFAGAECATMQLEQFGVLVPRLKKAKVERLVMAGSVKRRPRLRSIKWAFSTLKLIPRVAAGMTRGDDGLLRTVVGIMESNGITVVGAHEIVPDLLAPVGVMTDAQPTSSDRRDIDAASEAAIAIGKLDIGQGAIAIGGRVIALEGIEGTDGLLERTIDLRQHGRLAGKKRGVLAKRCKPQQELRTDLPAIGAQTMGQAHAAGLAGVCVEAGRSFILDYDQTIARANELGLFVMGLSATEGPA
jgi:DUF1009 family protein